MHLRLGFFDNFKGGDRVLLSATREGIDALSALLTRFVESNQPVLAIHEVVWVAPRQGTCLFVVADQACRVDGHAWLCNRATLPDIVDKLVVLTAGHQYFGLVDTDAELIVSSGEYRSDWWQRHG